ncbi:uncharacterized protein PAC_01441 [Phialocephala subalpina]|uniref:Integral membrane protein n=1 Tax=Phialocephala subalpina TaxID=576137 RepID=A0A1L7WFL0_9HELO|nr:uncharacterized protein PAC_01441 [Phialocephala subalpina]
MKTFLGPNFQPMVVTTDDLVIAALAFGFTLGFGFLTTCKLWQYTEDMELERPILLMFGWSGAKSRLAWCSQSYAGFICLAFFFSILTAWSLQVQFLLQIIINRISLLMTDRRKSWRLKIGVAVLITSINISVYNIWIPSRLQISPTYEYINNIWDRCEKIIFLLVDGTLNWYFIKTVREKLVNHGLTKYNRLVRFNQWIIGLSLAMDCLIIGMMSLNNSFVYMQFHPLAYIVKLNIEMSMAELIAKISSSHNNTSHFLASPSDAPLKPSNNLVASQLSRTFGVSKDVAWRTNNDSVFGRNIGAGDMGGDIMLNAKQEVSIQVERRRSLAASWKEDSVSISAGGGFRGEDFRGEEEGDTKPLKEEDRIREARMRERDESDDRDKFKMAGVERGMGVFTNIWGQPTQRSPPPEGKRNIDA